MADPGPDDTPPHDPGAIERLRRWGGATLVREMAQVFLRDVPERIRSARAALDVGDRVSLERHAHSLKSSCGQLGAARMQRLALDLERCAAVDPPDRLAQGLDALERQFAEHAAWLQPLVSEGAE